MKDVIIFQPTDRSGCAWYRLNFTAGLMLTYNTDLALSAVVSPVEVRDESLFARTIAIYIGKPINEYHLTAIRHYGRLKKKYGFRIVVDYDDCLFDCEGLMDGLPRLGTQGVQQPELQGHGILQEMKKAERVRLFLFNTKLHGGYHEVYDNIH